MNAALVALLVLGSEDYTGLWDALFEVQSLDRALSSEAARARAADLLGELATQRYVAFYSAAESLGRSEPTLIERGEYLSVLADESNWRVPSNDTDRPLFYFLATDRGVEVAREALRGGEPTP